jgi:hypothetical protein
MDTICSFLRRDLSHQKGALVLEAQEQEKSVTM